MSFLIAILALSNALLSHEAISVEIADTQETRIKGLSFRNELEEHSGMLFVYPEPQILSFWMKDTNIPLSIAFFDDKLRLFQIEHMHVEEKRPLKIYRSKKQALYALEMNLGWFEKHRIQIGDSLTLEDLHP